MILKYGDWKVRKGDVGLFYKDANSSSTYFCVLKVKSNGKVFVRMARERLSRVIDLTQVHYWKLI